MGKVIQRLLAISKIELANEDLIPVQDVSEPKTKAITIAELKKVIIDTTYPVGSTYTNVNDPRNPAVIWGVGTWVAHKVGRMEVGIDPSQTEFDTAGETGGQKDVMAHLHGSGTMQVRANAGAVQNTATNLDDFPGSGGPIYGTNVQVGNLTGNTSTTGTGVNNMNPYVVVYSWKRTA